MSTSAVQARSFYREVLTTGRVWAIKDSDGFPASEVGDRRSMPFWSAESRARRVVDSVPAYRGFEIVALDLDEWRSRWLDGLSRDGFLVGLNWASSQATGHDLEPDTVEENLSAREGC